MRFNRYRQNAQSRKNSTPRGNRRWGRSSTLEMLEGRELLAGDTSAALAPYHNPNNPLDVNHDNRVTPFDSLLVINDLIKNGSHTIAPSATPMTATGQASAVNFLDVNADNRVTPLDALRVINLLAVPKQLQVHTFATDMSGNPITTISVGNQFRVATIVTDVRNPTSATPGVFASYINVSYDPALSSIATNATVNFDPFFTLLRSSDLSTAGSILDIGASATSLSPPGNAPQPIWNVISTAGSAGSQTFTPSFDAVLGHDSLLYGNDFPLTADDIDFVGDTLQIVATPQISINNVTKLEGNTGTTPSTPFVFTVSLSNTFDQQVSVVVNTATPGSGNVATPGVDYTPITNLTLTFAPGEVTKLVTVNVTGDTTPESTETFNVVLSNPSSATLGNATGLGTITDDDTVSALSISPVTITNVPAAPAVNAIFTVTLSGSSTLQATVVYSTQDISAVAGVDYTATAGTLTFAPGVISRTITVPIIPDPNVDDVETFRVNLTSPVNASISNGQAIGTILPAVPRPTLSIGNVSLPEGDLGTTTNFVFTASLSSVATSPVVVSYTTADGTATAAGLDYLPATGLLTFAPGELTKLITVQVVGDANVEPSENFSVNLSVISGTLTNTSASGQGNILNDDGTPTISISDATVIAGTNTSPAAVFTVTVSSTVPQQVVVGYSTSDFTAHANLDYIAQSGNLTFVPGGPLTQTITVPIITQPEATDDESFFVNLSSPSGPADIFDGQGVGTIVRQGLVISGTSVLEDKGDPSSPGNALFTVTLTRPTNEAVTVGYSTADGTATVADSDYVPTGGTLTFAPGETTKVITVAVVPDAVQEGNETFFVNLSPNPSGTVVILGQAVGTILNDDGQQAAVTIKLADTAGNEFLPNKVLSVGDQFLLEVFVQDTQTVPTGILQAYVNAFFDANLLTVIPNSVTFGASFPNLTSATVTTSGVLDAGGFGLAPPADPSAPQLLFSVKLQAKDVGQANFSTTQSTVAGHEVFVFGNDLPVVANFDDTKSINIGENVFVVGNVQQVEGNSGLNDMVFTVTRFLPSNNAATVVFATSDGTATTADGDYQATNGTLTFAAGETTKTITVHVVGDLKDEADETFSVKLSNAVGATASAAPGVGTILNDDAPVGISVLGGDASEGQNIVFQVKLAAVSGKQVSVAYATANGTATAGSDYTAANGTLTFAPGETLKTVTVHTLNDIVIEADETFQLVLSNPVNGALSNAQATGTIKDVPPAKITGYVYVDGNNSGTKEGNEVGLANVALTLTNSTTGATATTITGSDGSYSFVGLPPGTYSVRETQPGFYVDGRDTLNGVDSPVNDQFNGVTVAASQTAAGYNFGEQGLRADFAAIFINRRALFSSAPVTGEYGSQLGTPGAPIDLRAGDAWLSFDGGWQGQRTITAAFATAQGTGTMTLYDNALHAIAVSSGTSGGAQLQFTGVLGNAYFLKVSGTNSHVVLSFSGGTSPFGAPQATAASSTGDGEPSAAPAVMTSSVVASAATSTTLSPTVIYVAPASDSSDADDSAVDLALEEDEDWLTASLLA